MKTIQVIALGPFGEAVARHLSYLGPKTRITHLKHNLEVKNVLMSEVSCVVIASWRPVPQLCRELSDLTCERKIDFLPIILGSGAMYIGPLVRAGQGGCWNCYEARIHRHQTPTNDQDKLADFYSSNISVGPQGYVEPLAQIAGGCSTYLLREAEKGSVVPSLYRYNLLARTLDSSVLLGVHNCVDCGLHRTADARSFAEMRRVLSPLWSDPLN